LLARVRKAEKEKKDSRQPGCTRGSSPKWPEWGQPGTSYRACKQPHLRARRCAAEQAWRPRPGGVQPIHGADEESRENFSSVFARTVPDDETLFGSLTHLPVELGALGEPGGAERVSLGDETAGAVDDLGAGGVHPGDALLGVVAGAGLDPVRGFAGGAEAEGCEKTQKPGGQQSECRQIESRQSPPSMVISSLPEKQSCSSITSMSLGLIPEAS